MSIQAIASFKKLVWAQRIVGPIGWRLSVALARTFDSHLRTYRHIHVRAAPLCGERPRRAPGLTMGALRGRASHAWQLSRDGMWWWPWASVHAKAVARALQERGGDGMAGEAPLLVAALHESWKTLGVDVA